MDYVEALLTLTATMADMRKRLIELEAKVEHLDGDTPSVEALVERIEELENRDWNDSWEDNVVSIAEATIDNIDFEDKVRDAFSSLSFNITVD